MTEKTRRNAVWYYRKLLDDGTPRKRAMLMVLEDLRDRGFTAHRATVYRWLKRFGVSTA